MTLLLGKENLYIKIDWGGDGTMGEAGEAEGKTG